MKLLLVALAPGSINHIANIVKGYAIAVGVAFAMWFVWQWWKTRQNEAQTERSVRARSAWARQLELALAHPELGEPMLGSHGSAGEAQRYRTYVAHLLATADEILALEPTDAWRQTLIRHLAPHRSYIASQERVEALYRDQQQWARRAILNVAGMGKFSSDRTISEYAEKIWGAKPVL